MEEGREGRREAERKERREGEGRREKKGEGKRKGRKGLDPLRPYKPSKVG